jgi:hypothetical protein
MSLVKITAFGAAIIIAVLAVFLYTGSWPGFLDFIGRLLGSTFH